MKFLACWYSHFDPAAREGDAHLLGVSLQSIAAAIEATEHDVTVRTCTWFPMGEVSPFEHEHISYHHFPSHLGIALQILRCLYEAQEAGEEPEFVTFHEHDVLYPIGYFDRIAALVEDRGEGEGALRRIISASYGGDDITEMVQGMAAGSNRLRFAISNTTFGIDPQPGEAKTFDVVYETERGRRRASVPEWSSVELPYDAAVGIANHNYIGLRRSGWCDVNQRDEPMHQLALRWPDCLVYFEQVVRTCVMEGARNIEFNELLNGAIPFDPEVQPSVHINHGRCFSSHGNIYKEAGTLVHPSWGPLTDYWHEGWAG